MARRAKRANKSNPREERNTPEYKNRKANSNSAPAREIKKDIQIIPRSLNQEELIDALHDESKYIVFAIGPAGTGKTMLSTRYAVKMLKENKIKKIVISRPNVAVDDKDIGYLPGDILSKMAPWIRPITAEMEDFFTKEEIEALIREDVIEIVPLAFIRGRTFKNSILLIDEAQNTTPNSLLSAMTRIGENSKMIITGDIRQSDRSGVKNGLADFVRRYEENPSNKIEVIQFNDRDIQRHPVITDVLSMYKDLDI